MNLNLDANVTDSSRSWWDAGQKTNRTLGYSNGDQYRGEFIDNKRHGQGTMWYVDGSRYFGDWVDDQRHGNGTFEIKNGTTGAQNTKNAGIFDWLFGNQQNKNANENNNSQEFFSRVQYMGEWAKDKMGGKGLFYFDNGDVYEGQFVDGEKHGIGSLRRSGGLEFVGEWVRDKMSERVTWTGKGAYRLANGKMYGHGVKHVKGKGKYVGYFFNGMFVL